MHKKIIRASAALLGFLMVISITLISKQEKSSTSVHSNNEIVEIHKENLAKSPFKETLKLTKAERKAAGIPPNKYFEEEYELTMNPVLGRPTFENLEEIRNKIKIMAANRAPGDGTEGNWVSRGPDNFGGRTRAVMFDPNDLNNETVFAGGVSGGLWKNTQISNANSEWTRVGIPSNLNISSIAYDPNNTSVFYVGTGESYVNGDVNG
ncbi:MAG: glycosyl hydrolase, partial [Flavobacteriaceae bacterium]|nr:glycosyl hydrolase [Flavobacteriaceae bacterium]